ncbi:GWT1-domain-containing protein [Mrakia frigida]|uniref:glucosaminyl-phosphotidylinositol O-acyltransferase n=1 Tax=Mrakia frigida TaxID=29902 RepID=UPI003FCC0B16
MSYKEAKENFVSGGVGTSFSTINAVSAVGILSYALYASLLPHLAPGSSPPVFIDYAFTVVPLLLGITVLSDRPWTFVALLLLGTLVLTFSQKSVKVVGERDEGRRRRELREDDTSEEEEERDEMAKETTEEKEGGEKVEGLDEKGGLPTSYNSTNAALRSSSSNSTPPQPFLTIYRAHMMTITVLAILAVDFPIFPRGFGKTELWGTSLMDVGVGSFVLSLGIISARPFLRIPGARLAPKSTWPLLVKSVKKSVPTLLLGLVRVGMVKSSGYPEHETEYGTHWNFFFTLGMLPPFGVLFYRFTDRLQFSAMGILVTVVHQLLLSLTPLQTWALTAPRTSLLSQNKEGIVSFPGYLAIYLLGLDLGHYLLPPSPSYAYRPFRPSSKSKPRPAKLVPILVGFGAVWWALLGVWLGLVGDEGVIGLRDGENGGEKGSGRGVSRRLANLPYVLWTAAFNTTFILGYLIVQLALPAPPPAPSPPSPSAVQDEKLNINKGNQKTVALVVATRSSVPPLLEAANKNALTVFLLANLLTGLVNVSMRTMDQGSWVAVATLVAYSGVVYGVGWVLRGRRVL